MEDVPVITGFALTSMESDKADFVAFSPVFADPFVPNVRAKQIECNELIKSKDVIKEQKVLTALINTELDTLRVNLNPLEGYLKMAGNELDIKLSDFGLKTLRTAISKGNVEGVLAESQSLFMFVKRNEVVLQAKGMKPELLVKLVAQIGVITQLNQQQNESKNKRSRVASENIKYFNELWDMLTTILDAGRAMYRGVDEVKLREYTMANLLKRVHTTTGGVSPVEVIIPKTETPA